jgi:signal peptide peptidase SppA
MYDRFAHIGQRLFNVPLCIHPAKAELVMAALADRLGIGRIRAMAPETVILAGEMPGKAMAAMAGAQPSPEVGYDVVQGVACIEISGTLVQKRGTLRPYSGMTGYDGVRYNLLAALDDPSVRAVALTVSSYGGEVSGLFDLVDTINAARGMKPVWAILDEDACSAAYAIACAADRVTIPRTGLAGSIGVIVIHADISKALDQKGIVVTMIHRGDRKTDGYPQIPLAPEALASLQADVDRIGVMFETTVARNRRLTPDAVRAMQAGTFMGEEAVRVGLVDAVMAPDAAFSALLSTL